MICRSCSGAARAVSSAPTSAPWRCSCAACAATTPGIASPRPGSGSSRTTPFLSTSSAVRNFIVSIEIMIPPEDALQALVYRARALLSSALRLDVDDHVGDLPVRGAQRSLDLVRDGVAFFNGGAGRDLP